MFGFYLFKYSLYSIIYLGIAVAGVLNQKYIETAFLFIAFVALRYCFPKTFHSKSVYRCVFWSIVIFWVAIPQTLPIAVSIFSSIVSGFLMTWVLYLIQDYLDCKVKTTLTIKDISLPTLENILNDSLLTEEEKSVIKYKHIKHLKGEELYNAMGYSKRQTIRIYKSALEKFNKLLQQ